MAIIKTITPDTIQDAANVLKSGGLVAFPTETVYGLGGNALSGQAVEKIYNAKGRPRHNPLIVHLSTAEQAQTYARINDHARAVMDKFWPGPLTLILPQKPDSTIARQATADLDTIALRVPGHKPARDLINACDFPLVAPSANPSGYLSPTTPAHVAAGLGDHVDMILAGGACRVGLESTVLDLSTNTPTILRPGAVTLDDVQDILPGAVCNDQPDTSAPIKSPGQILKHYAPRHTKLRLNAIDLHPGEALLAFGSDRFMGIQGGGAASNLPDTMRRNLSETGDLDEAAANLFAMLSDLDTPAHTAIAVMAIPDTGIGIAINERLRRAAISGKKAG